MTLAVVLAFAAVSFTLSASAGMGGSLVLVPALAILLGPKEGIAVSALLLAANNVAKVIIYRDVVPWTAVLSAVVLTTIGAAVGSTLMLAAPVHAISVAIILTIVATFAVERMGLRRIRVASAPVLLFFAGATSGFSGTSGPLKGIGLRAMNLERSRVVGAASVVSLAGDTMKVAVFARAALLGENAWVMLVAAIPLTVLASMLGRSLNNRIGERGYAALFWTVMAGYSVRLLLS